MTRPTKQILYAFLRMLNEYEVGNSLSDSSVEAQAASDFMDFTAAKDAKDPVLGSTVGQRPRWRWSHRFKCFNLMTAARLLTILFIHTSSDFFFNLRCRTSKWLRANNICKPMYKVAVTSPPWGCHFASPSGLGHQWPANSLSLAG